MLKLSTLTVPYIMIELVYNQQLRQSMLTTNNIIEYEDYETEREEHIYTVGIVTGADLK